MHRILSNRSAAAVALVALVLSVFSVDASAQERERVRREIGIPDIPGYLTLKCDFHMHTVFSDGLVAPAVRADEAWREGLDAFAITEHIESRYRPHEDVVATDHNRAYEMARPGAGALSLMIVRGAEITRPMPPGHLNAIFLDDAAALDTDEWMDALGAAIEQGAFVFWNHPGWRQPGKVPIWYDEHTEIFERGWMHGIEVVNQHSYYPLAHRWALEKGLTMLGNSDAHAPINMTFDLAAGGHRPVTLVFAEEATLGSLKEALFARRTAVWYGDKLIGEARFLRPIFANSVEVINPHGAIAGRGSVYAQVRNVSDVPFELALLAEPEGVSVPPTLTLHANGTVILAIRGSGEGAPGPPGRRVVVVRYEVENLLVAPEEGLQVELRFEVEFAPAED